MTVLLEKQFLDLQQQYPEGEVPCPESWCGYVVMPETIEFFQGRDARLHDRLLYMKVGDDWKCERLAP